MWRRMSHPIPRQTRSGGWTTLYSTFRAARIEPDSVSSRDAWGADRDWLREQRARHEQWAIRRSQILTGAVVALFTAALSIFGPWLIRVITHGAP